MARPQKQGLEYFSFDVSFFSDIRIRKLIKYHGIQAVPVYEILLCRIYEGGYYIAWDDDLPFIISEVSDLEEDTIMNIINYCIDVGLFNKTVFEEYKVLTSRSIQQRYVSACSLTKRKVSADMPYLLIEISNGHVNSGKTSVSSEQTLVFSEETTVNSEEIPINSENSTQRKEKERKDNNSLRSSLSPTPPTPSACVREGENEGDGPAIDPDGPLKVSDAVVFLRNDRDWQLQMQRKFKMEASFILRWLDSFVVDCDCRGKQEHESLSDVKQHFNDWMMKMSRSQTANGGKGSSLPHVISMEERSFIKLVAEAESHRLLGAQMMCARATDMIAQFAQAIANDLKLEDMAKVIKPIHMIVNGSETETSASETPAASASILVATASHSIVLKEKEASASFSSSNDSRIMLIPISARSANAIQ